MKKRRSYRRLYIAAAVIGLVMFLGPVGAYTIFTLNDVRH